MNIFAVHNALRQKGIMGINARNLDFIAPNNPRRLYQCVDDKVITKERAIEAGVRVPELYALLEYPGHFSRLRKVAETRQDFVIKPARGAGGGGILVISGVTRNGLRKSSGYQMSWEDVRFHVNNLLGGMFSLGGGSDKVLVERRLMPHSAFAPIAFKGVPDVRIVVYRGVPVMAMLRLPTSLSDGRANLHKGGVGAGVCIATGRTTRAVCQGQVIERHPDFDTPLEGFEVPCWPEAVEIAARLGGALGLGYVGVDLVIDEADGPTMLEVNARPGIAIQVANGQGLEPRLRWVDGLLTIPGDPLERARLAMERWTSC